MSDEHCHPIETQETKISHFLDVDGLLIITHTVENAGNIIRGDPKFDEPYRHENENVQKFKLQVNCGRETIEYDELVSNG